MAIETGEPQNEDAHAVGIDDGNASSASTASKAKSRAKRRGPGALGQLIGIVGGGFVGLAVGYYLLNMISPRYNFLNLSLPGIEQAGEQQQPDNPPPPQPRRTRPRPSGGAPVATDGGRRRPTGGSPQTPAAKPELFSSAQLGEALGAANAAVGCEACSSRGYVMKEVVVGTREFNGRTIELKRPVRQKCEVCGGNPSAQISPTVYARLCRLAHVVTNVNPRDSGVYDRRKAVESVLAKATDTPEKFNAISQQAAGRLDDRSRPDPGVLLVGNVQKIGQQGLWHTIELVLLGNARPVTVVTPGAPGMQPGQNVVIAGSIVETPSTRLEGYRGREALVVRGGMRLMLKAGGGTP